MSTKARSNSAPFFEDSSRECASVDAIASGCEFRAVSLRVVEFEFVSLRVVLFELVSLRVVFELVFEVFEFERELLEFEAVLLPCGKVMLCFDAYF